MPYRVHCWMFFFLFSSPRSACWKVVFQSTELELSCFILRQSISLAGLVGIIHTLWWTRFFLIPHSLWQPASDWKQQAVLNTTDSFHEFKPENWQIKRAYRHRFEIPSEDNTNLFAVVVVGEFWRCHLNYKHFKHFMPQDGCCSWDDQNKTDKQTNKQTNKQTTLYCIHLSGREQKNGLWIHWLFYVFHGLWQPATDWKQ